MNLIKSTSKVFVARVLNSVIMFAGITYFARELGATLLGMYFLYEALLSVFALIADFGVKGAIEKRLSEGEDPGRVLGSGLTMKGGITIVVIALLFSFGEIVNNYVGIELTGVLILSMVLQQLSQLMIKILNGEQRVGETAVIELSHRMTWFLVGGMLIIQGYGVYGLIYAKISALFVMFLIGAYRCSTPVGRPTVTHIRSLFDYAKFEAISGAGSRLFSWFDVLVIGFFLTQNFVGAYEIAWRIAAITVLFSMAIRQSIFPVISSLHASGEVERIEDIVASATTMSLFIVIPATFGAFSLSTEILSEIFGQEYKIASTALVILMLYQISYAVNVTTGRALQAIKHPDEAAYSMVAGIITNISLNIILVPTIGINGAALATMVSYVVMLLLRVNYLSNHIKVSLEFDQIAWFTFSSMVMAVVLLGFKRVFTITSVPAVFALVILGTGLYFAMVLMNQTLRKSIVDRSSQMIN